MHYECITRICVRSLRKECEYKCNRLQGSILLAVVVGKYVYIKGWLQYPVRVKVKNVKLPCNRPWRPVGLWHIDAPPFSLENRLTDGGKVVSLTRWRPFTTTGRFWCSFLLEAESTPGSYCGWKDWVNWKKNPPHRDSNPRLSGLLYSTSTNYATAYPFILNAHDGCLI
jgi:hypothetical protein